MLRAVGLKINCDLNTRESVTAISSRRNRRQRNF